MSIIERIYYFLGRLAPYWLRDCFLFATHCVSSTPRTIWYRTPGKSFTRPPRIITTECSWRLWPSPPIYAMTSYPLVIFTFATFRRAELGFFGVIVYTFVHTPRFWGEARGIFFRRRLFRICIRAGDLLFTGLLERGFLMSCCMVDMVLLG